jgi:hypothetical protein
VTRGFTNYNIGWCHTRAIFMLPLCSRHFVGAATGGEAKK